MPKKYSFSPRTAKKEKKKMMEMKRRCSGGQTAIVSGIKPLRGEQRRRRTEEGRRGRVAPHPSGPPSSF